MTRHVPTPREQILSRLSADLIGPAFLDELLIGEKPSDKYLTAILYPQRLPLAPEEDDKLDTEGDDEDESHGSEKEAVALTQTMRPASAGLSFAAESDTDDPPEVIVRIVCGTYRKTDPAGESVAEHTSSQRVRKPKSNWQRSNHDVVLSPIGLGAESKSYPVADEELPGLELFIQTVPWHDRGRLVTVAAVNRNELEADEGRVEIEEKSFFQIELQITPAPGTVLPARPSKRSASGSDAASAALLYRNTLEFAVGHTCSASWEAPEKSRASLLRSAWIPSAEVEAVSALGSVEFGELRENSDFHPLSASWLSKAAPSELEKGLALLPAAYIKWIKTQEARIPDLEAEYRPQAESNMRECRRIADRIFEGIRSLTADELARKAFQLANRAIVIQRRWTRPGQTDLTWWPFQLGFLLLSIPSLVDREHRDRQNMDLLWFPTGGGKTEAYLALIAMALFYRRLRHGANADEGRGVAAIMRYTLRLLTTQQFQRAAALILACEYLRRGNEHSDISVYLGTEPFSIGLWVGDDAVANHYDEAAASLNSRGHYKSPAQIERCPACAARLQWLAVPDLKQIHVHCSNKVCPLAMSGSQLPIWTVDDDIYRVCPSLLVGTVDKFAQIVRNANTGGLFGSSNDNDPPDLIVQDELHLISGPLGTMTGLYEIAVDELCSRNGIRPKVIGSTATIRRADDQIRALFNRTTALFPPSGIDARDSGFAFTLPLEKGPGRVYVGVTTAGRSAKFALQATCASILQSASSSAFDDQARDPYWTLVAYFNSLRELGGAVVLMRDDLSGSLKDYAKRRFELQRQVGSVEELTSRVTQIEVRDKLSELSRGVSDGNAIDVLLASNMISVGVDIPRLGLMVVNGQPKGIAEYIQATSRVGRGDVAGLVVTVYNNGKARDRSHYESFLTWHQMLYREVEATSVTPFASRARDRALHAVLIAIVRHTVDGMKSSPRLTSTYADAVEKIKKVIQARADAIDPSEQAGVKAQLEDIVRDWEARLGLKSYWNDRQRNTSLLMSAEKAAALRAAGRPRGKAWPTPNSMRNVEPGTLFGIVELLKIPGAEDNGGQ